MATEPTIQSDEKADDFESQAADDFESQAEEPVPSLAAEFWDFLIHNPKWWLTPIIIVLLIVVLLAIFASTPVAPFIYM